MAVGFYESEPEKEFIGDDERYPNFSIQEYFEELDIGFKIHESDDHVEYAINCPSCVENGEPRPDVKYRLWINKKNAMFHCYNCEWSGLLTTLIRKLSNIPIEKAIKILRGRSLDPLEHLNLTLYEKVLEPDELEFNLKEVDFPFGYTPIEKNNPYLDIRGIPYEYAKKNDWGFCELGFCKDRIVVPTYMNDKLVFWQARATWEDKSKDFKKVLNPRGISAKPILYQYDSAKNFKTIIIAEGFIDAAKIGPDAVATNGKKIHSAQIEWLQETGANTVILMYDREAFKPGRKKNGIRVLSPGVKAIDSLKSIFEVRVAVLPDDRDPGDYKFHSNELRTLIKNAKKT